MLISGGGNFVRSCEKQVSLLKEEFDIVEAFLLHLLLFNSINMSSNKEIIKWASGELHSILGYSDNNLAEYIVSLAKKAKNSNDLLTKLKENDLEESSNLISFSKRLYFTVHNKNKEVSSAHTTHITSSSSHTTKLSNAELLKQSQSYELVGMDDTTTNKLISITNTASDITAVKKDKKESKKASIRRKHDIDDNDEDQDNTQIYKKIKHKTTSSIESSTRHNSDPSHPTTTTDPDIDPIKQAQLDADIAERDEFVARLLDREEQRTKKLTEPQGLTVEQVKELATKGVLSSTGKRSSSYYYYLYLLLILT